MSLPTSSLLTILNTTNLQKTDNRLYQVIKDLITNLVVTEQAIGISGTSSGGGSGGFVTTSGGSASKISMFTTATNIEDVTTAGISSALDLL